MKNTNKTQEQDEPEVKMIPIPLDISESFYNFLKEYLAFFGSHMTVQDLAQQMIYEETRRLHKELAAFIHKDGNEHYVGYVSWLRKYPKVAETIREYPEGLATVTEAIE